MSPRSLIARFPVLAAVATTTHRSPSPFNVVSSGDRDRSDTVCLEVVGLEERNKKVAEDWLPQ